MSTLKDQMDNIFLDGITIIRNYKLPISKEWTSIVNHLLKANSKLGNQCQYTIEELEPLLFQDLSNKNLLAPIKQLTNSTLHQKKKTNTFILTLLENAVHKVLQAEMNYTIKEHQAVQYVFTFLSDQILNLSYSYHVSLESFIQDLVASKQLPIEWIALVNKENDTYYVKHWYNYITPDVIDNGDPLTGDSIYSLSDVLLSQMPKEERHTLTIAPIPFDQLTILLCTNKENIASMIPFLTYVLTMFQRGRDSIKQSRQDSIWKDSVIMFNEMILRSRTYNEALENITKGFVNYLPFERCALFSYSYNEQMGFGLYGHQLDVKAIQNITEDITNLPIIQNNLQILEMFGQNIHYLQPVYLEDASLGFPEHYVKQFQLKSVIIVPIFTASTNKLLGAAILDQGPKKNFKTTKETFKALIKYGQSAGELLSKFYDEELMTQKDRDVKTMRFSPREVEVLKLMAEGASTSEAATELNLSEYTVRDYISAIMQKMEARNRTEAVARAIREGII